MLKATALAAPVHGQRRALLIAIGKYPTPSDNLPGPPYDVQQMRELLADTYGFQPDEVETLVDQQATRDAILSAFSRLRAVGPEGAVLVYYSGHGMSLDRNLSVQDAETSGVDQALKVWGANNRASIILDDEIGVLIRSLRARRVVLLIDACYSGSADKIFFTSSGLPSKLRRARFRRKSVKYTPPGDVQLPTHFLSDGLTVAEAASEPVPYVMLGASDDTHQAYDGINWPEYGESHGVFTFLLVPLLRAAGSEDTPRGVMDKLRAASTSTDPCHLDFQCQVPQLLGKQSDVPLARLLGSP